MHMWRTDGGTIAAEGVGNGLWFTLQWAVDSMDAAGSLLFDRTGGTQGAEGFAGGGPFYIEGTSKVHAACCCCYVCMYIFMRKCVLGWVGGFSSSSSSCEHYIVVLALSI